MLLGIGLSSRFIGKAEIERRAMGDLPASGFHHRLAPCRTPALLHGFGQARRIEWRQAAPKQGAEDAVDQPARAAVDQAAERSRPEHGQAC